MPNIEHIHYPQSGRAVILGGGESGVGAAILAKDRGFEVFLSDMGGISVNYKTILEEEGVSFEEGQHTESLILNADIVIKSPGIPETAPLIQQLRQTAIPVISEIEFAAQYTDATLCCITGSNGKSTTTMLTYDIFRQAGLNVGVAGNIGRSFALQVAREQHDVYVLELSSFMLDDMHHFRAHIAILLNITPDHLDRYNYQVSQYVDSKLRIIQNQQAADYFIYCADDNEIVEGLKRHHTAAMTLPFTQEPGAMLSQGAYVDEQKNLIINIPKREPFTMNIEELSLQGKHNVYNNSAAGLAAKAQQLRNSAMKESMQSYVNIPHRLEHVACIGGVTYINDSKATNVNSVWYALESFSPDIVLIMGGVDKGNDYDMLKDLIKSKVKAIICIGKHNGRIHEAFESDTEVIVNSASMSDAVEIASHIAKKGDTVLLSPACASFDWFKNYEDRGDQFKDAVMAL